MKHLKLFLLVIALFSSNLSFAKKTNVVFDPFYTLLVSSSWLNIRTETAISNKSVLELGFTYADYNASSSDYYRHVGFSIGDMYFFEGYKNNGFYLKSGFSSLYTEHRTSSLGLVDATKRNNFLFFGLGHRTAIDNINFNVSLSYQYLFNQSFSTNTNSYSAADLSYDGPLYFQLGIGYLF